MVGSAIGSHQPGLKEPSERRLKASLQSAPDTNQDIETFENKYKSIGDCRRLLLQIAAASSDYESGLLRSVDPVGVLAGRWVVTSGRRLSSDVCLIIRFAESHVNRQ
jgi:hypothetical protein